MKKMVQALPQYREQLEKLSLHIHVQFENFKKSLSQIVGMKVVLSACLTLRVLYMHSIEHHRKVFPGVTDLGVPWSVALDAYISVM